MSYLQEFRQQIENDNLHQVLQLWEEYCSSDTIDGKELCSILEAVEVSDLSQPFGSYIELCLPLWKDIDDEELSYNIIKLILDIQTTNSSQLAEIAYKILHNRYGDHRFFGPKIRLIGLRDKKVFRGAITRYDLLSHFDKGKFIFHTGGWGTGEIIDYSLVREELTVEFEFVVGRREMSFGNAFKYLKPLLDDHFLARRFGSPDALEQEARAHPVKIVSLLLRNLGPKTAVEIKDELCELVIPAKDWAKWWQTTRARLKKDTRVETPSSLRKPFRLRETEIAHDEQFRKTLQKIIDPDAILQTIHSFCRDFSETLKNTDTVSFLKEQLEELSLQEEITKAQKLQIAFLKEDLSEETSATEDMIKSLENPAETVDQIDIVAHKKRALSSIYKTREDWIPLFLDLLLTTPQNTLKDYILKQLNTEKTRPRLIEQLNNLLIHPAKYPETFVWYFQKIMTSNTIPFGDKDGRCQFFEELLILFSILDNDAQYKELTKKIYNLLTKNRYGIVRSVIEGTSFDFVHEFLLLVTKCQTLSGHDIKIMHSLAEVVHPSLAKKKKAEEDETVWSTEEGYHKIKEQLEHLGTVEMVENAREIEAARALGDLKENSEYKFALEKRERIQAQIKLFSDQLKRVRILAPDDISVDIIGIGVSAELEDAHGNRTTYTLLGPWDTDPDKNIISFQSKMAKAMLDNRIDETFSFKGTQYTVKAIRSYLATSKTRGE